MDNKISIVIPAYNIENYLQTTLDSVVAQTYQNIEIIIVNDGSKDKTGEIIDKYASLYPFIKGIHKENAGVTSARLRGVEEASGEWIGFVDGDDFVEPDMYQKLLDNALANNADISHCGYKMVYPNGKIVYYYNSGHTAVQNRIDGLRDILSGNAYEPALCNKIYKKSLFDDVINNQLMDKSIKNTEDLLMNYLLFKNAKTSVYEDFCPYHYVLRKNSAATSKMNTNKLTDPLKVLKIIHKDIDTSLENMLFSRVVRQLVNISTYPLGTQATIIKPHRKNARKELRSLLGKILKKPIRVKIKLMALWAAIWPWSYSFVHSIHGKITGNAHKYDID